MVTTANRECLPSGGKYVCEADYNEQDNLCVECVPRENVELTAIRAERMVSQMREKAETANVFKGDIERKMPQLWK